MHSATNFVQFANTAIAFGLAAVAAIRASRGGRPGRWGAAAFVVLAAALLMAIIGDDDTDWPEWPSKALLGSLLAFPYLLWGFAASFRATQGVVRRLATAATVAVLAATIALPDIPEWGAARPGWYTAYLVVGAVLWTVLSAATIVLLWRGGTGQPTLARRRARLMAAATAGMNGWILLAAAGVGEGATDGLASLALQLLLLASLLAFGVGLAPPKAVRLAWRQPEQDELWRATQQLAGATTVKEVCDTLLPSVARIVAGAGAELHDQDGAVVASYGVVPAAGANPGRATREVVELSPPFGTLVVGMNPLTPFFAREEVGLLHGLGALADLSLARCMSAEREQESQASAQRAMREAKRANSAKSEFLSRMSHELRTPLNVVLGFGQILEMRDALSEQDRKAVEYILKGGRHLLELINEVLDLSRIESGQMAISPEPVEITELAGEALDLIRPLAQDRSIRLSAELGLREIYVTADRQRLKQVLLNLYSNAVKYNRDGGEVTVSCAPGASGWLRLIVKDTGAGVPDAMMDRLFEPFERLGAEHGQIEGTGLGLALSKQLVELMGGTIGFENREGGGSAFWIELAVVQPLSTIDCGQTSGEAAARAALGNRRVLLIEDNLANLRVIEQLLFDRAEIELLPAMTGRLGVELAREHQPDVILLDQHLPDISGADVLHRLKAEHATRSIPVVVVSADATPGQVRRMLDLGAVEYLTKPLDLRNFLRVLDGVLESSRTAVP